MSKCNKTGQLVFVGATRCEDTPSLRCVGSHCPEYEPPKYHDDVYGERTQTGYDDGMSAGEEEA